MKIVKVPGKNNKHKVLLYVISTCAWCKQTKSFLKGNNIEYEYDHLKESDTSIVNSIKLFYRKFEPFPMNSIDPIMCQGENQKPPEK